PHSRCTRIGVLPSCIRRSYGRGDHEGNTMTTNHVTRPRRSLRAAAGLACATALVAVQGPAHATPTHSTDDFDFDADGLCAFTVHLTVHNEIDATTQATAHGSIETDRVVETDMVAANGV